MDLEMNNLGIHFLDITSLASMRQLILIVAMGVSLWWDQGGDFCAENEVGLS